MNAAGEKGKSLERGEKRETNKVFGERTSPWAPGKKILGDRSPALFKWLVKPLLFLQREAPSCWQDNFVESVFFFFLLSIPTCILGWKKIKFSITPRGICWIVYILGNEDACVPVLFFFSFHLSAVSVSVCVLVLITDAHPSTIHALEDVTWFLLFCVTLLCNTWAQEESVQLAGNPLPAVQPFLYFSLSLFIWYLILFSLPDDCFVELVISSTAVSMVIGRL